VKMKMLFVVLIVCCLAVFSGVQVNALLQNNLQIDVASAFGSWASAIGKSIVLGGGDSVPGPGVPR